MGACSSSPESGGERKQVQMKAFRHVVQGLRITLDEADALYSVYDKADTTRDGFISAPEFFRVLNLKSSSFTRRIYMLFDDNRNEEVSFGEFVSASWRYLPLSKWSLIQLAFHLFDVDASGTVDADEVSKVVKEMMEDTANFDARMLDTLDLNTVGSVGGGAGSKSRRIDAMRFSRFALKNPAVLYPAARIQDEMRDRIGGADFWAAVTEKRTGAAGPNEFRAFVTSLKASVIRGGGLGTALTLIKDGRVADTDMVPARDVEELQSKHIRTIGALAKGGGGSFLKKLGRALSGRSLRGDGGGKGGGGSRSRDKEGGGGGGRGGKLGTLVRRASQKVVGAIKGTARPKGDKRSVGAGAGAGTGAGAASRSVRPGALALVRSASQRMVDVVRKRGGKGGGGGGTAKVAPGR